ncbi:MAG: M56 family metallopeptidase [Saprospiraceae bacterium]
MIQYLTQVVIFQISFLLIYDFFLKKETFFHWNRIYLLTTPLLSFLLPFIKISTIQKSIPKEYIINLYPETIVKNIISNPTILEPTQESFQVNWEVIWLSGFLVSLLLFFIKMRRFNQLKRSGKSIIIDSTSVIILPKTNVAFSFLKTIFLGENLSEAQRENIFLHEKIHVKHMHSLDLLIFELMRIFMWFNPIVYIFQNKIITLHEYIADAKVTQQIGKNQYYQDLLSQVFQTNNLSFTNTFFNKSLIKKRITMLQKSKSKKVFQLKYFLLAPVIFAMLVYTSCSSSSDKNVMENIDALKESIMVKGEITDTEMDALKTLFVLTMPNGLESSQFEEVKNLVEIPFLVIEKVPTYPGCSGDNEALKNCLTKKISELLGANFNHTITKNKTQKVKLEFKIGIDGKVSKVKTIAANSTIEKEVTRIISTQLPEMIPGQHEGIKVGVFYEMPVTFNINN